MILKPDSCENHCPPRQQETRVWPETTLPPVGQDTLHFWGKQNDGARQGRNLPAVGRVHSTGLCWLAANTPGLFSRDAAPSGLAQWPWNLIEWLFKGFRCPARPGKHRKPPAELNVPISSTWERAPVDQARQTNSRLHNPPTNLL